MGSARSLAPPEPRRSGSGEIRALRVPRPEPRPKPARRPGGPQETFVLERATRTCDFAFEGDVESIDDDTTSDSMLELQMQGMKVKEEAWPQPRLVPPPLPQLGPPPTISKTTNRAIRPPPMPLATPAPARAPSSSKLNAVDPEIAIAAFAGFGDPPRRLLAMPGYALRVRSRRRVLSRELEGARGRGSADVVLYEQAIASADRGAQRAGYALLLIAPLLVAAVVLALLMVASRP